MAFRQFLKHSHYVQETRIYIESLSCFLDLLNGTKFTLVRVNAPMPTDVDFVRTIVASPDADHYTILFRCGSVARRVMSFHWTGVMSIPEDAFRGVEREDHEEMEFLLDALLDALIAKNLYIVSRLRGNDEISGTPVNLAEVSSPTWTSFPPLSYEEADKAWSYLFTSRKIAFARKQFLLSRLMNFSDRSLIVLAGALNGKPAQIYPWSVYQVMQRGHAAPSLGER